jgi:hypothetical protein
MPLVLKDRVKETSTTTGTGTLTLGGAATGFQSFAVIGNGNTTYYAIFDRISQDWEVGVGTYTASGTTLSRDSVLESSNGGSLVNFGAGSKDVFCTYPAEKAVTLDDVQTLTNKTISGSFTGPLTGNASTASALQTARTIGGVSFDGTANINLPGVNTAGNQNTTGTAANVTGTVAIANGGTGATTQQTAINALAGAVTSAQYLRGNGTNVLMSAIQAADVPTLNQSTTGNAATATALQTARTIGGVSFNGTANINLPGVNIAGNQNTTGTAANITGTAAVANGGTGRTTLTANNVLLGNGTTAVNFVAPGTSGNVLRSNGTTWQSAAPPAPTIATTAEAQAGTNNTNVITPLRMREGFNASGSAPVYACRAWLNFDGTTTTPTVRGSGNVSSVTRNSTGNYTVNFTTAMPDADYGFSATSAYEGPSASNETTTGPINTGGLTTSSFRFFVSTGGGSARDVTSVSVQIFR